MSSKRILVTGTSRGIGLELVKHFLSDGHEVIAVSRNSELLDELALKNDSLIPMQAEITETTDVDRITKLVKEKWGCSGYIDS